MDNRTAIRIALKIIGSEGLSGIEVNASSASTGLSKLIKHSTKKTIDGRRVFDQLRQQRLLEISQTDKAWRFTLTPYGLHRLQQITIDELSIPRPQTWDQHWRMVSFDVPLKYSKQRIIFTRQLKSLGFYIFQRSIWMHPFPCFSQVEQLANHYNLLRYCSFAEIARLDRLSQKRLAKIFGPILNDKVS